MHVRLLLLAIVLVGHVAPGGAQELAPFISTNTEITLLTGNDAAASQTVRRQDSFTVIRLRPDAPPTFRTVYGETPHTVLW